ncbi:hypothetical protein E2320_010816 [Naja naja]|nr:hypothetical protein E2320_010816 [Naja naja]
MRAEFFTGWFSKMARTGHRRDKYSRRSWCPGLEVASEISTAGSKGTFSCSPRCTSGSQMPQGPIWPPRYWPQQMVWGPLPLQASSDGNPNCVALFLSQAISHLDQYTQFYPLQWTIAVAVTAVLEREAAECMANLHSEYARELVNVIWFDKGTRIQWAEGELLLLKRRGQSAVEYVREFCRVAGKLGPGQKDCWSISSWWSWTASYTRPVFTRVSCISCKIGFK